MFQKIWTLILACVCGIFLATALHSQAQSAPTEEHGAHIISPTLCYTLIIPGDWKPGEDEGTYSSREGKQFVGVINFSANSLRRAKGNTLVEKEAGAVQQAYEKDLRKKLSNMTLAPFESAMQGTWKWAATLPDVKDRDTYHSPKRYFIDMSPDGLIVLNIQGTPDDDELARRIIATVRHSEDKPCQLPRSVNDLLASASVRPGGSAEASPPLVTYNNALYGWSVSNPKGWKVDDSKPEFVLVQAPDKSGHCGMHTRGVEFKTAEAFAEFMLAAREKHFGNVRSLLRQPAKLPGGLSGIESLADIQATGRSHQFFAVVEGTGYIVDCETNIPDWGKLGPLFERVIRSFSVPNLAALTDADTAPPRTFVHPRHPWSIAYPGGWRLDASDPDRVNIFRKDPKEVPDWVDYAGCDVVSRPAAQFTTLDDFADTSLRRNAQSLQEQASQMRITSRRNISMPKGATGIEVLREISGSGPAGRSRVVFVLSGEMGYILDCQTSVRMWDTLAPLFEQITSSFTLEKRP